MTRTAAFTAGLAIGFAAGLAVVGSGVWLLAWALDPGVEKRAQADLVSKSRRGVEL